MASSFMGIYVQRDGINLAQKAQDVAGNNLTNSKTKGYTRQSLDLVSVRVTSSTLGYKNQIFLAGAGVDGAGVTQSRNKILDKQFRTHSSSSSNLNVKSNVLSAIEDAIDDIEIDSRKDGKEVNKTGFAHTLEEFKAAWQAFSSSGTDQIDQANIARSSAQNVVDILHDFSTRIEKISDDLLADTLDSVKRVNSILTQCANLNRSIQSGYLQMGNFYDNNYGYQADITYGPLEIKDKMNSLLDELSTYADVSSVIEDDGTYTISVSGREVVNHFEYSKLVYKQEISYEMGENATTEDFTKNADVKFVDADGKVFDDEYIINSDLFDNKPVVTEDGPVFTDGNADYVLKGDGKYYNTADNTELTDQNIIDGLEVKRDPNVWTYTHTDGTIDYTTEKIKPKELTFQFTAMKAEEKWKHSNVQFEKGNDFKGNEMYRAAMYDSLTKGEFERAYNIEREMTKDYTDFSALPDGYVPVFGKHSAPHAKDQIRDVTADLKEGSLKGDLDMYNGAYTYASVDPVKGENTYKGIEYYRQTFNEFTKTIVNEFNKIYTNNGIDDFKIFEFYKDPYGNEVQTTAQVKVAQSFEDNPIRSVHPEYKDSGDIVDESNFDQIANEWVNRITSVFEAQHHVGNESDEYTFEEFVNHYGNTLGDQLSTVNYTGDAEQVLLEGIAEDRVNYMGVSTDEEGVHMLTNQKWYNAMARMITALDQLLEKLINGTGVVGL